jgi:hypothetical protein
MAPRTLRPKTRPGRAAADRDSTIRCVLAESMGEWGRDFFGWEWDPYSGQSNDHPDLRGTVKRQRTQQADHIGGSRVVMMRPVVTFRETAAAVGRGPAGLPGVVHDAVVAAAGSGTAGTGAVAAQHLRGGPAVKFHQVALGAAVVQTGREHCCNHAEWVSSANGRSWHLPSSLSFWLCLPHHASVCCNQTGCIIVTPDATAC